MMDPTVLKQCIPACKKIEKISENEFFTRVLVRFTILSVKFNLSVNLKNVEFPQCYSITASAKGGIVDGASATGEVNYNFISDNQTQIEFVGDVNIIGRLLDFGEPLIQKTADKWFNRFFARFEQTITQQSQLPS